MTPARRTASMLFVGADLSAPPLVVGVAIAAAIGLIWGFRVYQRCPHCGRIARRVSRGWLRCKSCGRQYRKGLRVR